MPYQMRRYPRRSLSGLGRLFNALGSNYEPELDTPPIPQEEYEAAMNGEQYAQASEGVSDYPRFKVPNRWDNFITGGRAGQQVTDLNSRSALAQARAREALKEILARGTQDRLTAREGANARVFEKYGVPINPETETNLHGFFASPTGKADVIGNVRSLLEQPSIKIRLDREKLRGEGITNDFLPRKMETEISESEARTGLTEQQRRNAFYQGLNIPTENLQKNTLKDLEIEQSQPKFQSEQDKTAAEIADIRADTFGKERLNRVPWLHPGGGMLFNTESQMPYALNPAIAPGPTRYEQNAKGMYEPRSGEPGKPAHLVPLNQPSITPTNNPTASFTPPIGSKRGIYQGKSGWLLPDGSFRAD